MLSILKAISSDTINRSRRDITPGDAVDIRGEDEKDFLRRSQEKLDKLETVRESRLETYRFRKRIAWPAAIISALLCGYVYITFAFSFEFEDFLFFTMIVFGVFYGWATQPCRDYVRAYKDRILPGIARLFGDFSYSAEGCIDMAQMLPSKIVPAHHRYTSEDYFTGT